MHLEIENVETVPGFEDRRCPASGLGDDVVLEYSFDASDIPCDGETNLSIFLSFTLSVVDDSPLCPVAFTRLGQHVTGCCQLFVELCQVAESDFDCRRTGFDHIDDGATHVVAILAEHEVATSQAFTDLQEIRH